MKRDVRKAGVEGKAVDCEACKLNNECVHIAVPLLTPPDPVCSLFHLRIRRLMKREWDVKVTVTTCID